MSPQAARPNAPTVADPPFAPEELPVPTPFHTMQWTRAWSGVTTEQVTDSQVLTWPRNSGAADHLTYYRVTSSPLWNALEGDAGLTAPVWPGPITYAQTLYGEYGGLPSASAAVLAEAVDQGRELARGWNTAALVVSNLTAAEVQRWAAVREPDATVGLHWAHRVELPGTTMDDFITANQDRRKSRRELRRLWRRGTESGLQPKILRGAAMLPFLPDIVHQARATSERHGPALYGMDMLAPLIHVPGAFAVVADHPRGMAGAFVCFHHGDTVYLWTAAIDQSRRRALNTYGWLTYTSLAYACAAGATSVDAGRGNYRYKADLGMKAEPLACLVYLTSPDPALIARLEAMHRGLDHHAHRAWTRGHAPAA